MLGDYINLGIYLYSVIYEKKQKIADPKTKFIDFF